MTCLVIIFNIFSILNYKNIKTLLDDRNFILYFLLLLTKKRFLDSFFLLFFYFFIYVKNDYEKHIK